MDTASPDDVDRREVLRGREAGGEDDRVYIALDLVDRHDAIRGEVVDGVGHELDVVPLQGWIPLVRRQTALTPHRVVGHHQRLKFWIRHTALRTKSRVASIRVVCILPPG